MIPRRNFTVYKSSAGSGKTYTLVKEYLKIALGSDQPDRYRSILAITFTNKAANEMKERIIGALTQCASNEPFDMLDTLCIELNKDESSLRKRASKTLEHILHHYADFGISTIDKFVHKIVRTFAYDLKIPINFEVEMDGEQLISTSVDQLLEQVGTNAGLTKVLIEFIEGKTDDEKSWHIENDIKDYAKNLLQEEGQLHVEKLKKLKLSDFSKLRSSINKKVKEAEDAISSIGEKGLALIDSNSVNHSSFSRGSLPKYFQYLSNVVIKSLEPTATLQKAINEDKWFSGKCSPADKANIENIKEELIALYQQALVVVKSSLADLILYQSIEKNIYAVAVLNEIEKEINLIKQEQNILHISEFNKKIAQIVLNEPAPFIYERLGERYRNYLIDEFQDTSELQFQNLLPLIDNSLSTGNFNMLVGDGKQAIYRWRGGEVEQFAKLPHINSKYGDKDIVAERADSLKRNYQQKVLDTNYRSKKHVVDFNNWFFENISKKIHENYRDIYDKQSQGSLEEKKGGHVSLKILHRVDEESYIEETKATTLSTIRQVVEDGYSLKDITILCRKRKDANDIANFLVENQLPVISSDSLLISGNPQVKLIISLLKYLLNKNNDEAKISIANSILPEGDRHNQLKTVFSSVSNFDKFIVSNFSEFNSEQLLQKSLYETIEELIRIFGLNQENDPYLLGFLQFVHEINNRSGSSIGEFLDQWGNKKDSLSIQIPEGENAITIMTIHKSKGLQFPVVIFPFANWKSKGADNLWIDTEKLKVNIPSALVSVNKNLQKTQYRSQYDAEVNKTLLDNINLLYVAFTRPEDRLYIISSDYKYHDLSTSFIDFVKHSENWNEATNSLTMGEEIAISKDNKIPVKTLTLKQSVFNHWKPRVQISLQADDIWETDGSTSKKDYGKLLHYTLSKIECSSDTEKALEQLKSEGFISTKEFNKLEKDILQIINHKDLKIYFSKEYQVKNEAEIISANGDVLRPDRVAMKDNSVVVIDYKTGLMSNSHAKQITQYGDALNEIGFDLVTKLLVYTAPIKVVSV